MGALKFGFSISLGDQREEFQAMMIITGKRDALEREKLPGQHSR